MLPTNQALIAALPPFVQPYVERLRKSPLGYRLASGAFWSVAGEAATRAMALMASLVITRSLGQVAFGELGIIQSTIGLFGTLSGFGLGVTATKYVAQYRTSDPARAGRVIGVATLVALATGVALTIVMVLIGQWLAARTLAAPHLGSLLRVSSLLLLCGALSGVQTGALSGFEAFRRLAGINFWTGLLSSVLLLAGAVGWGLEGAVWAMVIGRVVTLIVAHRALRAEAAGAGIVITHANLGSEWRVIGTYSIPALMTGLLVIGVYWICNALLVNTPGGYAQMGVFNAANQWFNTLIILPATLGQAAFPVLSESLQRGSDASSRKVLTFSMTAAALVSIPVAIIGSLASPVIMSWYGPEFRDSWPVLVVVFWTAALLAIQTPIGNVIAASGRMWLGSAMNLAWGVLFVTLTWAMLARGAEGLAVARLLAYVAHAVWTFGFAFFLIRRRQSPAVPGLERG